MSYKEVSSGKYREPPPRAEQGVSSARGQGDMQRGPGSPGRSEGQELGSAQRKAVVMQAQPG